MPIPTTRGLIHTTSLPTYGDPHHMLHELESRHGPIALSNTTHLIQLLANSHLRRTDSPRRWHLRGAFCNRYT